MNEKLTEEEFEKRFDAGEDPKALGFDLDNAVVEEPETEHIDVDFPPHVLEKLDRLAPRRSRRPEPNSSRLAATQQQGDRSIPE